MPALALACTPNCYDAPPSRSAGPVISCIISVSIGCMHAGGEPRLRRPPSSWMLPSGAVRRCPINASTWLRPWPACKVRIRGTDRSVHWNAQHIASDACMRARLLGKGVTPSLLACPHRITFTHGNVPVAARASHAGWHGVACSGARAVDGRQVPRRGRRRTDRAVGIPDGGGREHGRCQRHGQIWPRRRHGRKLPCGTDGAIAAQLAVDRSCANAGPHAVATRADAFFFPPYTDACMQTA